MAIFELSTVLNDTTHSLIAKTTRMVCFSFQEVIDILLDYLIHPTNFYAASDAINVRDLHRKMKKMKTNLRNL